MIFLEPPPITLVFVFLGASAGLTYVHTILISLRLDLHDVSSLGVVTCTRDSSASIFPKGCNYISRDVIFDESVFPFAAFHPNAGAKYTSDILLTSPGNDEDANLTNAHT
jgi:hypothetical protein